jgi:hypothetical protein
VNHAVIAVADNLLACPTSGKAGLIRLHLPDVLESAIAPAMAMDFLDQQCGIAAARRGCNA